MQDLNYVFLREIYLQAYKLLSGFNYNKTQKAHFEKIASN